MTEQAVKTEMENSETQVETLEEAVEEVTPEQKLMVERDEWKDKSYRLAAEMENLKKRSAREIGDARKYGVSTLARELLGVQDSIEKAAELLEEKEADKSVLEGINMVQGQLARAMASVKVEKFISVGEKLNPDRHQAVVEIPTDEFEAGIIAQEIQPGYMIEDRLLRPAMVGVAKAVSS